MRRTVPLGDLPRGRLFWAGGVRYRVVRNLSPACVAIESEERVTRTVRGRTFVARRCHRTTWSCSAPVDIDVKAKQAPG